MSVCKRGHEHPTGERCIPCKRLCERLRYQHTKADKQLYQRQWRADYKLAWGESSGTAWYRKRHRAEVIEECARAVEPISSYAAAEIRALAETRP